MNFWYFWGCVKHAVRHHNSSMQRRRYKILCAWKLNWLYTELRNYLNNAISAAAVRELILFFKWEIKNWIVSAIVITIDKITTMLRRQYYEAEWKRQRFWWSEINCFIKWKSLMLNIQNAVITTFSIQCMKCSSQLN